MTANLEEWTNCEFVGEPPATYRSWRDFCASSVKQGVRISARRESENGELERLRALCMEHGCGHVLMIFDGGGQPSSPSLDTEMRILKEISDDLSLHGHGLASARVERRIHLLSTTTNKL